MAHIKSIGAGLFSDLAIAIPSTPPTFNTLDSASEFAALFATEIASSPAGTPATGTYVRIKNVREFPSMGTPPNIINVPVYGSKTSQQIQGQSDAPQIEITLNYVADDWGSASLLGARVGDGNQYVFRFALLNSQPTNYHSTPTTGIDVDNTVFYWVGKIEALLVNPSLSDANTATISISVQSPFYGAYTID